MTLVKTLAYQRLHIRGSEPFGGALDLRWTRSAEH
jgi:hypothetical protein